MLKACVACFGHKEQLAAKEKQLKEFEKQAQHEESSSQSMLWFSHQKNDCCFGDWIFQTDFLACAGGSSGQHSFGTFCTARFALSRTNTAASSYSYWSYGRDWTWLPWLHFFRDSPLCIPIMLCSDSDRSKLEAVQRRALVIGHFVVAISTWFQPSLAELSFTLFVFRIVFKKRLASTPSFESRVRKLLQFCHVTLECHVLCCRLQLLQLLCSFTGVCQRCMEHPVLAAAAMCSGVSGTVRWREWNKRCMLPPDGCVALPPMAPMPPFLVSFACFQFTFSMIFSIVSCLRSLQYPESQDWTQFLSFDKMTNWQTPGPMFDRLLGFDCITSKKASHEAPEQTHKHNVQLIQLIQLIFTTFHNYGHILSYINHSFVKFWLSSWQYYRHSFQWLRCCPPREYFCWQRSSICLTARLLKGEHHRRIAMANSKCKARGSGLRVLWDPLHAGVSPVHCDVLVTAWIYRFSMFFSSSCPRTTFSFTSVATELNNQSLRLMGSTRLCVLSWPVLNMSSSAWIEWSVCAPHIFTLCADGLAWDGVSRNAVWERMFCACCRGTLCQWTLQTTFQRKNVLKIQAHFILSVLSRCRWRRTLYMNWDTAIPQRPETEPCVVTTFVNCRCQIQ